MKTLNEVIKTLEDCEVRGGFFDWKYGISDALHYLEAFRDAKDALEAEKDRYAEAVRNCELAENKYRQLQKAAGDVLWKVASENEINPALTWQELMQMEGKPVWIENVYGLAEWTIVEHANKDSVSTISGSNNDGCDIPKKDYPNRWQAYRKERE